MVEDGASTPDSLGTDEGTGGHKLQRGDQGEEVKQVQTRLTELGSLSPAPSAATI